MPSEVPTTGVKVSALKDVGALPPEIRKVVESGFAAALGLDGAHSPTCAASVRGASVTALGNGPGVVKVKIRQ